MALIQIDNGFIKEDISAQGRDILAVNLKYPVFVGENKSVENKLNVFYLDVARKYFLFCKNRYAQKLAAIIKKDGDVAKHGAVMNWYVSFLNEKLLSMLVDVSFFDGKEKKSERLVHNWDLRDATPLRAKDCFARSREAKKLYTDEICTKILNREGKFSYYSNAQQPAVSKFDFDKFYFTPKGVAFYYDKNLLFSAGDVYPAFVIPYSEVNGITRLYRN